MPGLRDIARLERTVELRDGTIKITVRGISSGALSRALARSAEAERALGDVSFSPSALMGSIPLATRELLMEALDVDPESEEDRAQLENLTAQEQQTLLQAAAELSFPNGLGAYVAAAVRLLGGAGSGNDLTTNSSPPRMN